MAQEFRLLLVTPETTLLDQSIQSLRCTLFDGQIGILPGRMPMVGRLGFGELVFESGEGNENRYFVDGGFLQVKGSVISVLTEQAIPVSQLNAEEAEKQLEEALSQTAIGDDQCLARERDQDRARAMVALAHQK
ncbi:FoF1 ATP synthase subunit delta/epsilon [Gimesia panareensis]|uniref:ATP synthase epsilon chain n=1 Tax=Gimesia panareensis TaxID=2527978 RepID=A0A518A7F0_9PLAN|nr:F0F1 ATP synthase subunit epsilon [Gimesia panareensis]QDT26496.1 ATP synthase epsilon chain, sodium ion specific [Gimesia panareensis]QDU50625.1 ATP synthase epsilon chain, sodium ion specific [Gimesia panareensis]